ncbi:MAG TPA: DUF192 domain-containing protein [Clostridia bacterium]|nr:DUF192 domain-containing protein [Clostridia bacterium]
MNINKYFDNVIRLESFFQNFKGLMFKKSIDPLDCYILETNGIHTFFMKFPIDVIYLDKNKEVIKKREKMKPYQLASISLKCKYVLEFRNEQFIKKVNIGDIIHF